jgi:adenylate cyclase
MNTLRLDAIRDCFEGVVPCIMATSDVDGVPNVSMVSQIHYVDPFRIALSYQFFNKTRRNVLATRTASIVVFDPVSMAQYRMLLDYEETQTSGPIFESMKAKLAGIASHTGMHGIFRLLGSDLYRVRAIETISEKKRPVPAPERNLLAATRLTCAELTNCRDLDELCERTLACLQQHLGIEHSIILMIDEASQQLYTVASRGYPLSGIGSEVPIGDGVIGAAAREGVPVRINHMSADYSYGAAIRDRAQSSGFDWKAATEIPFPGLRAPESQIAVPIIRCGCTIGVLFAGSQDALSFGYDDQDALAIVSDIFGTTFALLESYEGPASEPVTPVPETGKREKLTVRHYQVDNSVFIDGDYLIKGVAGAVFWKLVREYVYENKCEFTNRELRLDPVLRLPAFAENLEARLVLLYRRLAEKSNDIRIEKIGRGRICLVTDRALALEEVSDDMRRRAAG